MGASNEMEGLLERIYMPSVFYFPKELFPELSPEAKKTLEEHRFFEDLGILRADGDVGSLKKVANTLEIAKKGDILDGNVFQLLEMKGRLKAGPFGFLFDKYLSNVKTWARAYKWLLENFERQIFEADENQKSYFEYQCMILDEHLIKLNQKFRFDFNVTAMADLVDVLSQGKKTLPLGRPLFNDIIKGVHRVEENKKHKPVKQHKKQVLLTNEEADGYLLKTVFNVRLG